jgi:hypothetical protein
MELDSLDHGRRIIKLTALDHELVRRIEEAILPPFLIS